MSLLQKENNEYTFLRELMRWLNELTHVHFLEYYFTYVNISDSLLEGRWREDL